MVRGNLLMLFGTLPAAHGIRGRLAATLGVLGRHAGARPMARTDVIWYSFFVEFSCARLRACDAFFVAATAARRIVPATFAAGGASSGPCERVNPQLTGRRILEVAP